MILLSTSSLNGYDLNHIFQFAKEAEFDGLDLNVEPKLLDTQDPEYLTQLITQHSLPIHAVTAPDNTTPEQIEKLVALTETLNAQTLVLQNPKTLESKTAKWLRASIPDLQTNHNITITIENAPNQYILGFLPKNTSTNEDDIKIFKHFCLNTTRLGEKGLDIIHALDQTKEYLSHVRLSNYKKNQKYTPLHSGTLPLESFLVKLKQFNYQGAIAIKITPKYLKAGDNKTVVKNLKQCRKFYETYFLKTTPTPPDNTPNNPSDF